MQQRWNRFWQALNQGARTVGDYQAKIILSVLYILLIIPVGWVARWSEDALGLRRRPGSSHWLDRQPTDTDIRGARRQS